MKKNTRREVAPAPPVRLTKRQLSHHQREQRLRAIIFGATGAAVLLIIGILGYGYWKEFLHVGDEAVATVGSTQITTRTMAKLMGFDNSLYSQQGAEIQKIINDNQEAAKTDPAKKNLVDAANYRLQELQSYASALDSKALDDLIQAEIVRREAVNSNLTLDQTDKDKALVKVFDLGVDELAAQLAGGPGAAAPATQGPPSADAVAKAKDEMNKVLDGGRILSDADFNTLVLEPTAYQMKVEDKVAASVPTHGEQVHLYGILSQDEQQSKDALAMLKDGKLDFAAAAKQLSQDPSTKDKGGDMGWVPKGILPDPALEKAAFDLPVDQLSDPIQTSYGYYIIKVTEKSPDRPIDAGYVNYLRDGAFSKWMSDQQSNDANKVTYQLDASKTQWAQNNMPKPTNLPPAQG